jgi:hypothetical protein
MRKDVADFAALSYSLFAAGAASLVDGQSEVPAVPSLDAFPQIRMLIRFAWSSTGLSSLDLAMQVASLDSELNDDVYPPAEAHSPKGDTEMVPRGGSDSESSNDVTDSAPSSAVAQRNKFLTSDPSAGAEKKEHIAMHSAPARLPHQLNRDDASSFTAGDGSSFTVVVPENEDEENDATQRTTPHSSVE